MHTGKHYTVREVSTWTRRETFIFLAIATVPTVLYAGLGWKWISVPWLPIAMVGTAVAFITGFKNNTSYGRLWEARQAWGAIVNGSRIWAMMAKDYINDPDGTTARRLIYRHIAWLTALRYQLRESRVWENMKSSENVEYSRATYRVAEWDGKLEEELAPLLDPSEQAYVLGKKNRAAHLIALQSRDLRELTAKGNLTELRQIEMEQRLAEFYNEQGRCERIKNFPYPRQFATLNIFFVWLFIVLVPFGMLQEFQKLGDYCLWFNIPACVIVAWVFHTMDKIGAISENPFEGSPNDVPITSLSRTIEIDLREMLDETDLPPAITPTNNVLM